MQRRKTWILGAMVSVLFAAAAAIAGGFDSPDGEPPYGLEFPDGRSGQQFEGIATIVFRGLDGTTSAQSFDSVVRLRKGGEYHVFYAEYACGAGCEQTDPCEGGVIKIEKVREIQLCIESLIQEDVIAPAPYGFGLGSEADVRLKDVSDFKAEPRDAAGETPPVVLVVGADVVVTTR